MLMMLNTVQLLVGGGGDVVGGCGGDVVGVGGGDIFGVGGGGDVVVVVLFIAFIPVTY